MNRKQLLAIARAQGYTGDADLAKVKQYLADNGITINDINGKAITDIDAVWAKTITVNADPGDDLEDDADIKAKAAADDLAKKQADIEAREAAIEAEKAKLRSAREEARTKGFGGIGATSRMSPVGFERAAAHKSYAARFQKNGLGGSPNGVPASDRGMYSKGTSFEDPDTAEAFGAWAMCELLPKMAKPEHREIYAKANITTTNTSGGALVPDVFQANLIELKEIYGVGRQCVGVTPMQNDTITLPRRTGGLTVYAPGEATAITESNPAFDNVRVTATKLATLTTASNELLNDAAINIGDFIAREIAYAFAQAEDDMIFNGDGTSTYYGYTGIRAAIKGLSGTIANIAGLYVGTGNLYSELTLADFQNTIALAPQYVDGYGPAWHVHKTFYHNVMQRVALAAGGVTANEVAMTGYTQTPMFLGYPVLFVQKMPRVEANSQVSALFGSLSQGCKFGEVRGGMSIATSDQYQFNLDTIAFRGIERVGFTCHDVGNASATAASRVAGPIVGLITAAS